MDGSLKLFMSINHEASIVGRKMKSFASNVLFAVSSNCLDISFIILLNASSNKD
jgi:hypothetical protein